MVTAANLPLHRRTRLELVARALRYGLTALAAGILVLQANGYSIDFATLTVEKLGAIVLTDVPSGAQVTIDGNPVSVERRAVTQLVYPGSYVVSVQLAAHQTWQRNVQVGAGAAVHYRPVLFYEEPSFLGIQPASPEELRAPFVDPRLIVIGGEVWLRDNGTRQLVTRFASPMRAATLLDDDHLAVVVNTDLVVLTRDGMSQQILLTVEAGQPVRLVPTDRGRRLAVVLGETTRRYELR